MNFTLFLEIKTERLGNRKTKNLSDAIPNDTRHYLYKKTVVNN